MCTSTAYRAVSICDPAMASLDRHGAASDILLLKTGPGSRDVRLVMVRFAAFGRQLWAYCECLVCEGSVARFYPSAAALAQHLNDPLYRDPYVRWPMALSRGSGDLGDCHSSVREIAPLRGLVSGV